MYGCLGGVLFNTNSVLELCPVMSAVSCSAPLSRRQRFSALKHSLKTIVQVVSRDRQPRVLPVRKRTVAKVDSTGLVGRIYTQCSAGKSSNVNSTSRSLLKHSTALGDFVP